MILKITEYIEFGEFSTKANGWYLEGRDAPSPQEKEVLENLLFSQGSLDFSMIGNEKFFDNRIITYTFKLPNTSYADRKSAEREIKNKLMRIGRSQLFDSHDEGFHWFGKFKSVKVKDDAKTRSLIATLEFDCYPFLIAINDYFDDIWDDFSFEYGVANWSKWHVNIKQSIPIYNPGDTTIVPRIITSANIQIIKDGKQFNFSAGESENVLLRIAPRELVYLDITGTSDISFRFAMEVLG